MPKYLNSKIFILGLISLGLFFGLVLLETSVFDNLNNNSNTNSTESNTGDLNTALFYNPFTLEEGTFRVTKLNHTIDSPSILCHKDRILFCVGVKDQLGIPIKDVSLTLIASCFIWPYYEGDEPDREYLVVNESSRLFVTNTTGIAEIVLNYDQETWRRGVDSFFLVESSLIENKLAVSEIFRLNYLAIRTQRSTNSTGGLDILNQVENSNLIEEVLKKAPPNENEYLAILNGSMGWGGLEATIINSTTINGLEQRVKPSDWNYFQEFTYNGWVMDFSNANLTRSDIESTWNSTYNQSMYFDSWLSSESLSTINISEGWLILQKMEYERFSGPLNGDMIVCRQVVILDNFGQIQRIPFDIRFILDAVFELG
ncbi:MAG: hypothetical protein ACFFCQ_17980, partial [Promethearchaeota archaeon]